MAYYDNLIYHGSEVLTLMDSLCDMVNGWLNLIHGSHINNGLERTSLKVKPLMYHCRKDNYFSLNLEMGRICNLDLMVSSKDRASFEYYERIPGEKECTHIHVSMPMSWLESWESWKGEDNEANLVLYKELDKAIEEDKNVQ